MSAAAIVRVPLPTAACLWCAETVFVNISVPVDVAMLFHDQKIREQIALIGNTAGYASCLEL